MKPVRGSTCHPGLIKQLVATFGDRKKNLVHSIGFGGLLGIKYDMMGHAIILSRVVEQFDVETRTLNVNGAKVGVTSDVVQGILGISNGGDDVQLCKSAKDIQEISDGFNLGDGSVRSWGHLLKKSLLSPGIPTNEFKLKFALYALSYFLAPNLNKLLHLQLLGALRNVDEIPIKNWATFILDSLVHGIQKFKQGNGDTVTGCLLILVVLYMDSAAIGGVGVEPLHVGIVPRISTWGSADMLQFTRGLVSSAGGLFHPKVAPIPDGSRQKSEASFSLWAEICVRKVQMLEKTMEDFKADILTKLNSLKEEILNGSASGHKCDTGSLQTGFSPEKVGSHQVHPLLVGQHAIQDHLKLVSKDSAKLSKGPSAGLDDFTQAIPLQSKSQLLRKSECGTRPLTPDSSPPSVNR